MIICNSTLFAKCKTIQMRLRCEGLRGCRSTSAVLSCDTSTETSLDNSFEAPNTVGLLGDFGVRGDNTNVSPVSWSKASPGSEKTDDRCSSCENDTTSTLRRIPNASGSVKKCKEMTTAEAISTPIQIHCTVCQDTEFDKMVPRIWLENRIISENDWIKCVCSGFRAACKTMQDPLTCAKFHPAPTKNNAT